MDEGFVHLPQVAPAGPVGTQSLVGREDLRERWAEIYDNYDVSFHNEIWASTFFGNFAAASTWHKERVFWWGGTQPPPESPVQNPIGYIHTKVLNAINTLNPNGIQIQIQNRTLYHNFKPLADFLANPNLQAYNLFNGDFSPHKVYDNSTKIETYYLTNADSTFAIGWVHNVNAYWEKHYYVMNDPGLQNFFGCTAPGAQQVAVPGLQTGLDYHITWFPTRMNDTIHPADAVDTSGTGIVLLDMSTTPLGDTANKYLDTLRLDYAFIIALQPVHSNRQVPVDNDDQEVNVSDWDFGLFPNPASEHLNVLLPDDEPTDIVLYDLSGRSLCGWHRMKGPRLRLPISQLAPGAYYLRVSTVEHNKTKPLIIR